MIDMQKVFVEDHIHRLEHEAAALRAERARDAARQTDSAADGREPSVVASAPDGTSFGAAFDAAAIAGTPVPASSTWSSDAVDVVFDPASARARIGRWLVGVGTAIAGGDRDHATASAGVGAAEPADGPCDDGPAPLSHAA